MGEQVNHCSPSRRYSARLFPHMLTDNQCKAATCPADKARVRFADSGGLYLEVTPNGSKRWFYKYRVRVGDTLKEKRLALGAYPAVSLKQARLDRDGARLAVVGGTDVGAQRRIAKVRAVVSSANTLRSVADEWFGTMSGKWSEPHRIRERRNLDKDLLPWLGDRPIDELEAAELLGVLRKVEARGSLDVAGRVLTTARGVWAYAVSIGKARRNVAKDLDGRVVLKGRITKSYATTTDPEALGQLLRAISAYHGGGIVAVGLWLAPRLFQRPSELRCAEWSEFDLDAGLWRIPAVRMKRDVQGKATGEPHLVPLAAPVVEKLRQLQQLTGGKGLIFPSLRGGNKKPVSDRTFIAALAAIGYTTQRQTMHGFRATARTLLDEVLGVRVEVIEAQLAHGVKDANGRSYNRTEFVEQRRDMMQRWALYLARLEAGDTPEAAKAAALAQVVAA